MNRDFANRSWLGYLAVFVWRFGGVSGITRRLVKLWPGEFTKPRIREAVCQLYPGILIGEYQIEDCIDHLRWEGRAKLITVDAQGVEIFKACQREFIPPSQRQRQLKFDLV